MSARSVAFRELPASVRAQIGGKAPRRTKNKLAAQLRKAQAEIRRAQFLAMLERKKLPAPTPELEFAPDRKWRFDYAWESAKLALEVEGGVWTEGRHTRGSGFVKDMDKYNAAAVLGWRLLRVQPDHLTGLSTETMIRRALAVA